MTKHYAVLGSPISHSLSPKIHGYCFALSGIDAEYHSFDVSAGLAEFLDAHPELEGVSVTTPLKDEAFALSATKSELAQTTRSVNTLLRDAGGWKGFNTDVFGIRDAISENLESMAVLGSGATARSALAAFPNARKFVYARNQAAAEELAQDFGAKVVDLELALEAQAAISTLPKGVLPELLANQRAPRILLDAAYQNPKIAAEKYVSGVSMLIHQAIYQQRIFRYADQDQPLENEVELARELTERLSMAK